MQYSKTQKVKNYQSFIIQCLRPEHANTQVSCDQAWVIAQGQGISSWPGWVDEYNKGSRKVAE